MFRRSPVATLVVATLLVATAEPLVGEEQPKRSLPGVTVKLVMSVETYDPTKPSKGIVRCLVANNSKAAVDAQVGYDGHINRLAALGEERWELTLYPPSNPQEKLSPVRVAPGREQSVFELPLDKILLQGGKDARPHARDRRWRWDWLAEMLPPLSPVHRWRTPGYVEKARFWAEVSVSGTRLSSEKALLKLAPMRLP